MAKQKTDHTPEQSAAPSAHRSWRARLTGWMRGPQDKPVDVLPVRVGDAQYRSKALPPTTLRPRPTPVTSPRPMAISACVSW